MSFSFSWDQCAALLLLVSSLIAAGIQRLGSILCSSLTSAIYPVVMLSGSIAGAASFYLFVMIFGWIGLVWWLLIGIALAFPVRRLVAGADGIGTLIMIVAIPAACYLWFAL